MKTATATTVIRNGQLIDGNGGPPVRDAALVIRDGRLVDETSLGFACGAVEALLHEIRVWGVAAG